MIKRKIIVIGGGPAGLMAAGQAALTGAEVLLLEKMDRAGRKLSITGKGRCNLTNEAHLEDFLSHFGPKGRFLKPALSRFCTSELVDFFRRLGIPTVIERGGRIFPETNRAQDVVDALLRWATSLRVALKYRSPARRLLCQENRITGLDVEPRFSGRRKNREDRILHPADAVILATGGASYPATGSTGDGYSLAESLGHAIIPIRPALVPLETKGDIAPRLQGLSLKNVRCTVWVDGRKKADDFGEMLFTHFGLSGPIILTLSLFAVDALQQGEKVVFAIDLKPGLDHQKLDARLIRDFASFKKRQIQTILKEYLPSTLIPVCLDMTAISPDKRGGEITSEERKRFRLWLKDFAFEIKGHRGFEEAIITAGGVDTQMVNPHTMESRLVKGLFFAGEILDVHADTGGYNLQAAFSTGWLAGRSAAAYRAHPPNP